MKKKASAVIKGVGIGMIAGGATAVAGSMMMGSGSSSKNLCRNRRKAAYNRADGL